MTQLRHDAFTANTRPVSCRPDWMPAGTVILTMDGALPVEFLNDGDRVITRAGMRVARRVRHAAGEGGPLFALDFDAPQVIYADGREVATAAA